MAFSVPVAPSTLQPRPAWHWHSIVEVAENLGAEKVAEAAARGSLRPAASLISTWLSTKLPSPARPGPRPGSLAALRASRRKPVMPESRVLTTTR